MTHFTHFTKINSTEQARKTEVPGHSMSISQKKQTKNSVQHLLQSREHLINIQSLSYRTGCNLENISSTVKYCHIELAAIWTTYHQQSNIVIQNWLQSGEHFINIQILSYRTGCNLENISSTFKVCHIELAAIWRTFHQHSNIIIQSWLQSGQHFIDIQILSYRTGCNLETR